MPTGESPACSSKRIFPNTFCCTTAPIWKPSGRLTRTRDLKTFAGRVSISWGTPEESRTSSLWVKYWSSDVSTRAAFFSALCPTSTTEPIWVPRWSNTAYSFVTSMSFVFWLTTSTGSVNSVPPP
jgi:hypothetical protein